MQEYCVWEFFKKKRPTWIQIYCLRERHALFIKIKTHSNSNKYFSSIIQMPMILINKICVIIGARVC
jgi:hypothetical protein